MSECAGSAAEDFRPPALAFAERRWSSDELAAVAAGWLDLIRSAIPTGAGATAVPLPNRPDAVALFFALSTLPLPVVVLPADSRAWRTDPPIPRDTPVFLLPAMHDAAPAAAALGLRPVLVPAPRPAPGPAPALSVLASPGFVNFTSGSTGLPKPVYILTRSFVAQTRAIIEACRLSAETAVAASLPLATHYGFGQALLLPTILGAPLGLVERFDHRSLLRLFASAPYGYWAGTPLMADALARAPLPGPPPAVPAICHISAGKLSTRVFLAFRERFGVALRPNYGQTENGFITVDTAPDDQVRPGSVGRAAPGISIRVGDDPLAPFPPGRLGRVWFTSPWYMQGYGFPPRLSAREGRDGWWPTQDIGVLDDAGSLTLAGRADDCFKSASGYLVNPGEIANAFCAHPAVRDVLVLPVQSGSGPLIGALVERDGGVEPDELRATAARTLSPWLVPQVLTATSRLPRLPGGKPDRAACRAMLGDLSADAGAAAPSTTPAE